MKGKYLVISFTVIFILLAIGTTIARMILDDDLGLNQAGIGLANVQKAATVWAETHDGAYPEHIALLQANNYFRATLFEDPRRPEGTVWHVNGVDARPYMQEIIRHHDQERIDRTPLLEAVATDPAQDEPYYRFGDYWFVRLDKPRGRDDLIFGWTLPDEEGRRFIVFDNGDMKRIDGAEWVDRWDADAQARQEIGIERVARPDAE